MDTNHVSTIFQHVPNLKGVKNDDGDRYNISEFLTEKGAEIRSHYQDLAKENRNLPVTYQAEIKMKAGKIQVDGKDLKYVKPPAHAPLLALDEAEKQEIKPTEIWEGEVITVSTSSFIGYVMEADSFEIVKDAYKYLRAEHLEAQHVMCAYRLFGKKFASLQNYSDDGEVGGGRTLLKLLKELKLFNTVIFVVRIRDQKNIGAKRFIAIEEAAKSALSRMTKVTNRGQAESDQELVVALNSAPPPDRGQKGGPNIQFEVPGRPQPSEAARRNPFRTMYQFIRVTLYNLSISFDV